MTGTFGNEDGLPRVPLPTLEDSAARFLAWCAPLLADELAETEAAVGRLPAARRPRPRAAGGAGGVRRRAEGVHSWLDTFWPYRYLGRRDRIALNANFFFLFDERRPRRTAPGRPGGRAHRRGALDYKLRLDAGAHPAGRPARARRMSMEQNKFLFSTTRIPGARRTPSAPPTPRSGRARPAPATSWCSSAGNMFRMDVLGPDGAPHTPATTSRPGCAPCMKAGAEPAARAPRVGPPDHQGPRRVGRPAGEALLACHPAQRGRAGRRRDRAVLRVPGGLRARATPRPPATSCCTATAATGGSTRPCRSSSSPTARAGINVEHCGLDGTTILSFVDAMLGAAGRGARRRPGRPVAGAPALAPVALRARRRAAGRRAGRRRRRSPRTRRRTATRTVSFDDFGSTAAKAAGDVAGRVRPDGLPAGPPAREGARGRHLRVDRHPAVPARAHRGDARRHPRDAGVRGRDGRPGDATRRRPARAAFRAAAAAPRGARQGVPGRARRPSSTCGSCS